jgi:fibronectin-binding autotransporter adhesin
MTTAASARSAKLLATTALVPALFVMAAPAWGQERGGQGGEGVGALGGVSNTLPGGTGGAGASGSQVGGGGGGGGAGVTGGRGGNGSGGATGGASGTNGQAGSNGGGGGGGGGGSSTFVPLGAGVSFFPVSLLAQSGGNGGAGSLFSGGGGGGGAGASIIIAGGGTTNVTVNSSIVDQGGAGGNGGNGGTFASGGDGGDGGTAFVVTGVQLLTVNGQLLGGTGGNGGAGGRFGWGGDGGAGLNMTGGRLVNTGSILGGARGLGELPGSGGAGVIATTVAITNSGTIAGGEGGASSVGIPVASGIVGNNITLNNTGTISGGLDASGVRGLALRLSGTNTISSIGTLNGGIEVTSGTTTFDIATDQTLANVITGAGSIAKLGTGTLTLTGENTYVGETRIAGGTLQIGDGGTTGSLGTGNIVNNAALVFNRSDLTVVQNIINGTGSVTKRGAGTLALTAGNGFSGGLFVEQGEVSFTPGSLGSGTVSLADGTTLSNGALNPQDFANSISIADGGTATLANRTGLRVDLLGIISGGNLVKTGTGTFVFENDANSFASLDVREGSVGIAANRGFGGGTVTLQDNTAIVARAANLNVRNAINLVGTGQILSFGETLTLSGNISGGTLVKSSTGTLVLTGTNTYGATSILQDIVQIDDGNAIGTGTITIAGGATLRLGLPGGSNVTLANDIVLSGGTGTISTPSNGLSINLVSGANNAGSFAQLEGDISGPGALRLSNFGLFTLSGNNTYEGGTTLDNVYVRVGSDQAFGTGAITTSSIAGLFVNDAGVTRTLSNNLGGAFATIGGPGDLVLNGAVSVSLEKVGSGVLTLNNAANTIGGNNVYAGTIKAGANGALGRGALQILSSATLQAGVNSLNIGNSINVFGSAALTVDTQAFDTVLSGTIAGSGGLAKTGSGTLTLTGTNTYTGRTTISAGTLRIASAGAIGSGAIALGDGTTLRLGTSEPFDITLGNAIELSGGTAIISLNGSSLSIAGIPGAVSGPASTTLSGPITGSGGLRFDGLGIARLSGNNTYSGDTFLRSTYVDVASDSAFGTGIIRSSGDTGIIVSNGAAYIIGNDLVVNETYIGGPGSLTLNGVVSGTNGIVKIGQGVLALNRTNSFTGGLTIVGGTIAVGASGALGSGTIALLRSAVLRADADATLANAFTTGPFESLLTVDTQTFNLTLGGARTFSGLNKLGTGTLVLTGAGTNAAPITITAGTLQVGDGGSTGTLGDGAIVNNGTLAFNRSDDITVANVISGTGGLTQLGAGTLTLTGANTYSGLTTIASGTLLATNNSALGSSAGGTVVETTGTLALQGEVTLADAITLNGSGFVSLGALRNISGPNILTGPITLASASTIHSDAGTVQINGTVDNGGHLLTVSGLGDVHFVRAISGAGGLTKTGSGQTRISGVNTYSGTTTVTNGRLVAEGGAAIADSGAVVVNGGTFALRASETIGSLSGTRGTVRSDTSSGVITLTVGGNNESTTFGGGITDGFGSVTAFTKVGTGTLTLTGTNTFTGETLIKAGKLVINGSLASSVTVDNTGTLGGSGTLTGNVSINEGGTLAPGNSPGTLTIAGNLDLNVGSTSIFELGEAGVAGGANNDLVAVGGNLALNGGTIRIVRGAGFGSGQYTLFTFGTLTGALVNMILDPIDGGFLSNLAVGDGEILLNTATAADLVWWNGSTVTPAGAVEGGDGTWSLAGGNFTDAPGAIGGSWAGNGALAIFGGTAGTVTIAAGEVLSPSGLSFRSDGYVINGGDAAAGLALTGPTGIDASSGVGATINAALSGSGSLTKTGAGTLTLAGSNTYAGETVVLGGTLVAATNGALGAGAAGVAVADGATLALGNGISISKALTLNGVGVSRAGALQLGRSAFYEGPITLASASRISADLASVGDIATDFDLSFTGITIVRGTISGTGNLTLESFSDLQLRAASTYTGTTTISANSLLSLSGGGTLGTGNVINNGSFLINRDSDSTIANAISGAGSLQVLADGTATTLTGANSYAGETVIILGTLIAANDTALGTAAQGTRVQGRATLGLEGGISIVGEALTLNGTGVGGLGNLRNFGGENSFTGPVTLGASSLIASDAGLLTLGAIALGMNDLTVSGGGDIGIGGAISGSGSLTKTGAGTLTLSGANTYDGGTLVSAGTQIAASGTALGSTIGGTTVGPDATLALQGGITITSETLSLGGGGAGGLGALRNLSEDNSFLGPVSLSMATRIGSDAGQLTLGDIALGNNALAFVGAGDTLVAGVISGAGGSIEKSGTGTLTLSGANTFGGPVTVGEGTLVVTASGQIGSAGAVNDAALINAGTITGLLDNGTSGTATNSGTIGGGVVNRGTLTSTGTIGTGLQNQGTAEVRGRIDGFVNNAGTLTLTGTISGIDALVQTATGTFDIAGFDATLGSLAGGGSVQLGSGGLLRVGGNNASTGFGGVIAGAGAVVKTGSGTLTLTGANTYTGTTTVEAGTLAVAAGGRIAGGVVNAASLTNAGTIAGQVNNNAGASFTNSGTLGAALVNLGTASNSGTITGVAVNRGTFGSTGTLVGGLTNEASARVAGTVNGSVVNSGSVTLTGTTSGIVSLLQIGGSFDLAEFDTTIGTLLGSGSITLGAARLTTGRDGVNGLFGGVISGSGSLAKVGIGRLVLTGANTYTGGTTIGTDAILQLGDGGETGSVVGSIANNGALVVSRSNAVTLAGPISGTGVLVQDGTGTTTLAGSHSYSGGTLVNRGRLVGTTTSLQGLIQLNANGTLEFAQGGAGTFAGSLAGTGLFEKTGTGLLALTGNSNGFTGATTVRGGELRVTGGLARSVVTVQTGATLSGTGVIGGLVAQSGSTIAPGTSPGTLGVAGNVTLAAGSTVAYEIGTAGASDLILATGTASLDGTAAFTNLGAANAHAFNTEIVVLQADGGRTGTFANATGLAGFGNLYRPELVYTGTQVRLRFAPNTLASIVGSTALTDNQRAVVSRIDGAVAAGYNPQGLFNIYALPAAQLPDAFDQLSGEIYATAAGVGIEQERLLREAVLGRTGSVAGAGRAAPESATGLGAWGQLFGGWGNGESDGNASSFDSDRGGFATGIDYGRANENGSWRIGAFGFHVTSDVTIDRLGSHAEVRQSGGGAYASLTTGAFGVAVGGYLAAVDLKGSRNIDLPGFRETLAGRTKGDARQAFAEVAWSIPAGKSTIRPFVTGAIGRFKLDALRETGGAAALDMRTASYSTGSVTGGLDAAVPAGKGVRLSGTLAARAQLGDRDPQASLALAVAPQQAFAVSGAQLDDVALAARLEAEIDLGDNAGLTLGYTGLIGDTFQDHGARATLNVVF